MISRGVSLATDRQRADDPILQVEKSETVQELEESLVRELTSGGLRPTSPLPPGGRRPAASPYPVGYTYSSSGLYWLSLPERAWVDVV